MSLRKRSGISTIIFIENIAGLFQAYGGRTIFWIIRALGIHESQLRILPWVTLKIVFALFFRCLSQPLAILSISENLASSLFISTQPKWKR